MRTRIGLLAFVATVVAGSGAFAADGDLRHITITSSSPSESVRWYVQHMECQAVPKRPDAARCGKVDLLFLVQQTTGSTQGTGVNHIGFSFADLTAKMAKLQSVGVQGTGVRLQRFPDGSALRDVPGLFKIAFIFDPWGTRIELVEDREHLGFHHVHLSATDPAATLAWYRDNFGGKAARLKGQLDGVQFDGVWVLASRHAEGAPATTEGRAIDHLGFVVEDIRQASTDLQRRRAKVVEQAAVPKGGRSSAKRAMVVGPDNVRLAVVEPGFAGIENARASAAAAKPREPYVTPKTPWGEPDFQGVWTGNGAQGIPLERPADVAGKELTAEQAEARRERGTLGSIWGYEREWRDTTLGFVKTAVSTQVAMVVDPADGRIPPLTPEGQKRAEAARQQRSSEEGADMSRLPQGPEDLSPYVRCITRGLPGMMMPSVYNNGLQIKQGPGFVALQIEMVHETRVIPTQPRPRPSAALTSWLGDAQGRWDGDTLVIETTNFNGQASFRGASPNMKLIERYTRVGPTALEYRFTVEDPTTWTAPWTAMFTYDRDDEQYELVEYSCHEGNYGMTNILSGARAQEKAAQKPSK